VVAGVGAMMLLLHVTRFGRLRWWRTAAAGGALAASALAWSGAPESAAALALLAVLLDEVNTGIDPFTSSNDSASADFARLATWLAQVDPTGPLIQHKQGAPSHPRTLMDQMGGDPQWVPGDVAGWDAFARWTVALGLARERPTTRQFDRGLGLMPDLYPVVRDALERVEHTGVQTLESLLMALAGVLPILTNGRLDRAWRSATSVADDREVPPPLSFALFRLWQDGRVELLPAGDGVPYLLRFGAYTDVPSPYGPREAEQRRYSNVRVLKESA